MKRSRASITILLIQILCCTTGISQSYYALSLVENKGQWPGAVLYRGTADAGVFFLERNGYTIMKQHPEDVEAAISTFHGGHGEKRVEPVKIVSPTEGSSEVLNRSSSRSIRTHTYKVSFLGSSPGVTFSPEKPTGEVSHYFLGNDPSKWKTDVAGFAAVTGKGLYPGIDIRYYSNAENLKYDLMIAPGADPGRIALSYEGVDGLKLENGVLVVNTSVGESRELKPYAYQIINGYKKEVFCNYEIKGNQVRYKIKDYDKTASLVIDPDLIFSTFSGSSADNFGATAAPGPDGSLYGAGIVYNDAFAGYPTTNEVDYTKSDGTAAKLGASFTGGYVDIGITRFSKDGSSRIYSVYLGGDGEDFPHSIFVDPAGYAYILGRTNSTNFPLTTIAKGPNGGTDILLAKLSPDGRRLEASTRIGGSSRDGANITDAILVERPESLVFNYGDHNRSEVILDKSGFVYIAVSTASDDFPTTNATNTKSSMQDGVVMKLSPDLKSTIFTTFIGGNQDDAAFVLALHPVTNEVYAAGATRSNTLSGSGGGGYRSSNSGIVDGFVAQLDISGKIVRSSFYGTDKEDFIYGIQFNKLDPAKTSYNPFIMGVSVGDWPVVGNPKYVVKEAHQFIAKLKDDLSDFVYSTTFGAPGKRPNISPVAFLVDRCENVYVSGWGGKLFPCGSGPFDLSTEGTFGLPVVSKRGNIIQNTTDGRDFYFFVLQRDAASQLYGSFFGQFGGLGDHVDGGTSRFDEKGAIYQAMCAGCYSRASLPRGACAAFTVTRKMITTPGVVAPVVGNRRCNLGVVKIDLDFDAVESAVESEIGGKKTSEGCGPQLKVDFTDIKGDGKEYLWDFGDGSGPFTTTDPFVSHTYVSNVDRTYTVTVISTDNDRCVPTATATMTVKLSLNKANLQAKAERQGPCGSNTYLLKNLTTSPTGTGFSPSSFQWTFNDGVNPVQVAGLNDVGPITFTSNTVVQMKLIDPGFCNSSSSVDIKVNVDLGFQAKFRAVKDSVCLGEKIELVDESIGIGEYAWEFEPGSPSLGYPPPTYVYATTGDKTIKLTLSENSPNCNRSSDAFIKIYVKPLPIAAFDYNPKGTTENLPITFTNLSTGGVSFQWSFGDGVQSNEPSTVRHLYTQTGDYKARLTAFNIYGCRTDQTQVVSTTIVPLMKVPSGFTPNGDGKNDILYFYAFGLDQLVFKIYNRWGQLVFETTDPLQGWDGTFKGIPQPMDTYTYTYMIRIAGDRKSQFGKGDVTLIR